MNAPMKTALNPSLNTPQHARGFTLIEMIIVMVILGILSVFFMGFVKSSIDGYTAVKERAEMVQGASLSSQRITRDIQQSLPNSVRISTSGSLIYLEFVPTTSTGRYRYMASNSGDTVGCAADVSDISDNSVLSFGDNDSCFEAFAYDSSLTAAGQWLVIYNMGPSYNKQDFYENGATVGGNKTTLISASATTPTKITFTTNNFTFDSPGHRFFTATTPVTYVCDPVTKEIRRYWNYGIQATQPTSNITSLSGVKSSALIKKVSSCSFYYAPSTVTARYGVVSIMFNISTSSGNASIQSQAHVSNVP